MTPNRTIQIACAALAAACLLLAGLWAAPVADRERENLQLLSARDVAAEVPPEMAFASTMLGPLRPIMVNALWYRLEQLKQEGRFFEINELSNWITTLQPHFPKVWTFHAWNMAYNVSVKTYTEEERWDWVNKGVRLLRERALKYNPQSVAIYRELTWIFFHKIGQYSDDVHWYYKTRLCREWQELLGAYAEGRSTAEAIAAFARIAEAPDSLATLRRRNADVARILDNVILPAGYAVEGGTEAKRREERERLARDLGKVLMYNYAWTLEDLIASVRAQPQYYDPEGVLVPLLNDAANRPAVGALLGVLRKRTLIDNYNMDPARVLSLMIEWKAPLDLRHASAHALYWSHLGVTEMRLDVQDRNFDWINTLRQNMHAAQDLNDSGRLVYDPIINRIDQKPDVRYIDIYHKMWQEFQDELAANERVPDRQPYKAGHENLLLKAFVFHMFYGNEQKAREYRALATTLYANESHNDKSERYKLTDWELLLREAKDLMPNMESTAQFLDAMIGLALQAAMEGRPAQHNRFMDLAKQAYDKYQKEVTASGVGAQPRMQLRPLKEVVETAFYNLLISSRPLELRSRLWRATDLGLRQSVYARVQARLMRECEAANLNMAAAFPAPPPGAEPAPDDANTP